MYHGVSEASRCRSRPRLRTHNRHRTNPPPVIKKKTKMLKTRESTKTLKPATMSAYTVCRVRHRAIRGAVCVLKLRGTSGVRVTMDDTREARRQGQDFSDKRSDAEKSISARALVKAHVKAGSIYGTPAGPQPQSLNRGVVIMLEPV